MSSSRKPTIIAIFPMNNRYAFH